MSRRRRHRAAAGAVRRAVTGTHHLVVVASRLEGGAAARTLLPLPLPRQQLQPTAPALGSPYYLRVSVAPQPTHLCCCSSPETFSASKIFAFFARRVTPSVLRIVFGLCISPGGGRRSPAVGGGGGARERGTNTAATTADVGRALGGGSCRRYNRGGYVDGVGRRGSIGRGSFGDCETVSSKTPSYQLKKMI